MATPIYHITNTANLAGIAASGCLWCDTEVAARGLRVVGIAHRHIKDRRAGKAVAVGPGGVVADYVPFYFAPRSPMLYAINRGSVAEYSGGQRTVVHLVSTVERVLAARLRYCFTDGHAEMGMTRTFADWESDRDKVPWEVMPLVIWKDTVDEPDRKRRRQAEFLVHTRFPLDMVEMIGVYDSSVLGEAARVFAGRAAPRIEVRREWYYG